MCVASNETYVWFKCTKHLSIHHSDSPACVLLSTVSSQKKTTTGLAWMTKTWKITGAGLQEFRCSTQTGIPASQTITAATKTVLQPMARRTDCGLTGRVIPSISLSVRCPLSLVRTSFTYPVYYLHCVGFVQCYKIDEIKPYIYEMLHCGDYKDTLCLYMVRPQVTFMFISMAAMARCISVCIDFLGEGDWRPFKVSRRLFDYTVQGCVGPAMCEANESVIVLNCLQWPSPFLLLPQPHKQARVQAMAVRRQSRRVSREYCRLFPCYSILDNSLLAFSRTSAPAATDEYIVCSSVRLPVCFLSYCKSEWIQERLSNVHSLLHQEQACRMNFSLVHLSC